MTTRVLGLQEITESQQGKFRTHNTALHQIDSILGSVLSRSNGGPPSSPSEGDAYIVDSASGDWSSATVGDLAVYYEDAAGAAAWVFTTPATGPTPYVENESIYVQWTGSGWQPVGAVAEIVSVSASKTLTASDMQTINRVTDTATITVPADSTEDLVVGFLVTVRRATANAVTISSEGGVTINGSTTLAAQNDSVDLMKVGDDEWDAY